jgi:hypothetical protein
VTCTENIRFCHLKRRLGWLFAVIMILLQSSHFSSTTVLVQHTGRCKVIHHQIFTEDGVSTTNWNMLVHTTCDNS